MKVVEDNQGNQGVMITPGMLFWNLVKKSVGLFFMCLLLRPRFIDKEIEGRRYKYVAYIKGRWYSPVFWVFCVFTICVSVFDGGLIRGFSTVYHMCKQRHSFEKVKSFNQEFDEKSTKYGRWVNFWYFVYVL